ncbi:hypothetical protein O6H91_12G100300 [Diphasiastrum complanatum]|uniref:Uncharacterized protein n=1 Tax=Diphasiastrum complanatum TaxID=34168 RepID=A0ACC2C670_DIPCM|nr:hypothetical protein O6H91_12G100300 [Diphasiastrum complanatum]
MRNLEKVTDLKCLEAINILALTTYCFQCRTSADHSRPSPSGSNIPINSWYPPSVLGPASSLPHSSSEVASPSRVPSRTNTSNPGTSSQLQHSHSNVGAVANMFPMLKDKSVEELRKLLSDKEAYRQFLHTFDDVQQLDHVIARLWFQNLVNG